MNIFYDYQIFEAQKFGGISRYFYELIRRNESCLFPIRFSNNEYLLKDENYNLLPIPRKKRFDFLNKKESNLNLSNQKLIAGEFDLFHPTYFDTYFLNHIGSKPFVLTVHDMINELFPEYYDLDDDIIFQKKELINKATRIIAVSNTTKRDLLRFYPHVENKVDVVYHGCSLLATKDHQIKLPDNYILFVGNRNFYKNFYFFVESILPILKENRDLYLVCTGATFSQSELIYFEKLGLSNKILHYFADDSNLFSFYENARVFVYLIKQNAL
jgi:glycosyltransferase involved in cell wall biosynthesis